MDFSTRRGKIIVAVALLILLATIVTLAVVLAVRASSGRHNNNGCQFSAAKPATSSTQTRVSGDYTAMVTFSGYLGAIVEGEDLYLPLELMNISVAGDEVTSHLSLWTDCARLTLTIRLGDNGEYSVNPISVVLERETPRSTPVAGPIDDSAGSSLGGWRSCDVSLDEMNYSLYEGYACNKRKHMDCKTDSDDVVVLVLDSINFETDGNPDKIRRGEFSKPHRYCSPDLKLNSTL